MSGIERSSQFAAAHQPGQSSKTSQNKGISAESKATQDKVINNIADVVTAPFNLVAWVAGNWQLVVIGAVAIFVLIRD